MNDGNRHFLGRRALLAGLAVLPASPLLAWDFGTVRSTFTTIIRRRRDGPLSAEWRNSDYRNFTILGMNAGGTTDDFHVEFILVHPRKISCELMVDKSRSDAPAFGLWLGSSDEPFKPEDVVTGSEAENGSKRVTLERTLGPGSYRAEALWRGRLGTEIVAAQGHAMLTITIHSVS
jgi:hypothetical protein